MRHKQIIQHSTILPIMSIMVGFLFFILCAPARAQWSEVKIDSQVPDIIAIDGDTIIVRVGDTSYNKVLMSVDGGTTWKVHIYSTNDSGVEVSAIEPGNIAIWYGYIKGQDSVKLWKSTDAGLTWMPKKDSANIGVGIISWSNSDELYTVNGYPFSIGGGLHQYMIYLVRSENGGEIWDTVFSGAVDENGSSPAFSFVQDMKDSNTIYWYVTVTINESVFEQFFVSHDKGKTASELLPPGNGYGTLYANPGVAGDIYYLTSGSLSSQIWHSSNYGTTWDTVTSTTIATMENSNNRNDTHILDFIVSKNNPGLQFVALDTGIIVKYAGTTKWVNIPGSNFLTVNYPKALTWDDATQTLYAFNLDSTGKGQVWKWQMPTAVNESNAQLPATFALGQNYPNPVNSMATVPIDLKTDGAVTLVVYTIQGKEVQRVQEGELSAGTHTMTIDLHDLQNGTYIYSIKDRSQRQSKLLTVMH